MNRRTWIVSAGGALAARAAHIEERIAKRDFRNLTREDLPTPCMVVDLDLFEANVRHMMDSCKQNQVELRAHVKIHKSPEISKRQIAAGASGVCCATIAEAELMTGAGIQNVLLTGQAAGREKITRVVEVARRNPTFTVAIDDESVASQINEAAGARRVKVNALADLYAGLTRQGCPPGEKAVSLARRIDQLPHLTLRGLMAYSGTASHTKTFTKRTERSKSDLAGMLETHAACRAAGLNVPIRSGGSTGTYNIDPGSLTELQAGSFIFMDTLYMAVGGKSSDTVYEDFRPSLTVLTTVISKHHSGRATIDAGNKAMLKPTDQVKGMPHVKIENQGAEYGLLVYTEGDATFRPGDKVELYCSNLDTSTNVYDRYYISRGGRIIDAWPIMGRSGAAQR